MIQTAGMVLRGGVRMLCKAIGQGAERDARLLMAEVLGVEPGRLTPELGRMLTPAQVSRFEHLVRRRMARAPVSHILGRRLFWGREFRVTPDVLDPRPETETIVARALELGWSRVLDLGTGSGCLLVSLLAEREQAHGVGTDISEAALAVARENAERLGVMPRAEFACSDWWESVAGRFDLVVSNPPYIPEPELEDLAPEVRDHEPRQALTPGADGLAAYRVIAAGLAAHLEPGGHGLFEVGAGQAEAVAEIFRAEGMVVTALLPDMDGRARVVEVTTS